MRNPKVRFRRGELLPGERLCVEALQLVSGTESRLIRLWLGPLYIQVLLALGKPEYAAEHLARYHELVAGCQTPRFSREAARLARLFNQG